MHYAALVGQCPAVMQIDPCLPCLHLQKEKKVFCYHALIFYPFLMHPTSPFQKMPPKAKCVHLLPTYSFSLKASIPLKLLLVAGEHKIRTQFPELVNRGHIV